MSKGNPEKALAALNAAGIECGRFTVRPLTLGMCAVLDAIGSPLVGGPAPKGVGGWAETLFAMTRPAAESRRILASGGRAAFSVAAAEWADGVSADEAVSLCGAAAKSAETALGVHPDGDGGKTGDGEEGTGNGADPTLTATAGYSGAPPPRWSASGLAGARSWRSRLARWTCS